MQELGLLVEKSIPFAPILFYALEIRSKINIPNDVVIRTVIIYV